MSSDSRGSDKVLSADSFGAISGVSLLPRIDVGHLCGRCYLCCQLEQQTTGWFAHGNVEVFRMAQAQAQENR